MRFRTVRCSRRGSTKAAPAQAGRVVGDLGLRLAEPFNEPANGELALGAEQLKDADAQRGCRSPGSTWPRDRSLPATRAERKPRADQMAIHGARPWPPGGDVR